MNNWDQYIKNYIDFKTIEDRDVCINWINELLTEAENKATTKERNKWIRKIKELKKNIPPYPMEGDNAEMITWAAKQGYTDALDELLDKINK